MPNRIRTAIFNGLLDDSGHGEPVAFLIDIVRTEGGDNPASPAEVVDELRRASSEGLMTVSFVDAYGRERRPWRSDYERAVVEYVPNGPSYIIADCLIATLTCAGQAEWRTVAEQWQLELSKHGRVIDDQEGQVTVMAACEEMARQLLAEWHAAHPEFTLSREPPIVEEAHYSLSPGFPESGTRMTWRLLKS